MKKYKAVISQEDAIYYVEDADIVKFISENCHMEWNETCDFVFEIGIINVSGLSFWQRKDVFDEKLQKQYNPIAIEWMTKFFEAHPFMENIMIVFDD